MNSKGRFGEVGGQYISETLMNELIRLEECYNEAKNDPSFNEEVQSLLNEYAGRPSYRNRVDSCVSRWQNAFILGSSR